MLFKLFKRLYNSKIGSLTYVVLYLLALPLGLILTGLLLHIGTWLAIFGACITGVFTLKLFMNTGCLFHKLHHRQLFAGHVRLNQIFRNILCTFFLMYPKRFIVAHKSHHKDVHTYNDLEFKPLGKIKSKALARLDALLSMILGGAYWYLLVDYRLTKEVRDYKKGYLFFWVKVLVIYSAVAMTKVALGIPVLLSIATILGILYLTSLLFRHKQFVEHLGIILDHESYDVRCEATRSLRRTGFLNAFWNFLTSYDSVNHIAHHRLPREIENRQNYNVPNEISLLVYPKICLLYLLDPHRCIQVNSSGSVTYRN